MEEARKVWAAYERQDITGPQLATTLGQIFKKDCSRDQAEEILRSCSPYQVTGHDTASDVKAFLSDFKSLEGRVSTGFPASSMDICFKHNSEAGRFSTCVGYLLSSVAGVALKAMNFQQIWDLLREFATESKQLNYVSTKNLAEKTTNEWKFLIKSKLPDNIIMGRGKVLAFGEEKEKPEQFEKAKSELTAKVVELPPAMYGKLKFVICYAAAGHYIQFFMLRLRKADGCSVLVPVTEVLDSNVDLPRLVLYYIRLYFLLLGMGASVSARIPFPLHTCTHHGHCEIKLTLDGAVKKIPDFESYSSQYGISFDDLKAAYTAAKVSGGYMISSVFGPGIEAKEVEIQRQVQTAIIEGVCSSVSFSSSGSGSPNLSGSLKRSSSSSIGAKKKARTVTKTEEVSKVMQQMYEVETLPLCAEKEPRNEEDLRQMAYGVLQALKALHAAGLVHRDIRFSNVMYDYSQDKYVLIDLESVGKDGQVPPFKFKGWNAGTLDVDNCYTKLSDLHQLGLLLESIEVQEKSRTCMEFINLLLSKTPGSTAENVLQHRWILRTSGDQTRERDKLLSNMIAVLMITTVEDAKSFPGTSSSAHMHLREATVVFDGMKKRNYVTWNSVIAGYAQARDL